MRSLKKLIGARIKSLREVRQLTQEALSEKMDINTIYLSNIERGVANPTLDMFIRISDALGVEIWELFDSSHEAGTEELRDALQKLSNEVDEDKLKTAVRVLKIIAR
jgi:transcriptional regulator with XRE-family HTH domain